MARQVRERKGEQPVRAHELEDAVEARRVETGDLGVELRVEHDVVGARLLEPVGLVGLPRRGDDGAAVVLGEEDGPEPDAAGAAVHQDRGAGSQLGGFEERSPRRPHAHEDAAEYVPG